MKKTRFFAAAFALLSVFSCQKEEQQVMGDTAIEEANLITCTFAGNDTATKTTTTDGKTPLWAAGDEIMLYDGVSYTQKLTLAASGETPSSAQGVIDGTDATKFTFVKPGGWAKVYAIYPYSACVTSFSAGAPKIYFAGQNGSFAKANICAATEVSGTMSFKNVGAILKFTSKSVKAAKVVVPVSGLADNFEVSFSGTTPSLNPESGSNSNEFSIGTGSEAVYIGVPAGSIAASSVFTYKTSADATLGTYTTGVANTVEANKIYNLGAMMCVLPGVFTVSAGSDGIAGTADDVKVQFSRGNLYYDGSAWKFENNQYDYRTYEGNNSCIAGSKSDTGTPANHWGSFGWSTSGTTYGMSTSTSDSSYSGEFKDWGENPIANGGNTADLWKTLSKDEWTYLLSTRTVNGGTGEGKSYQRTTLILSDNTTAVYGVILAPDNYTGALSAATTWSDWRTMDSEGCVFLPAAGSRYDSYVDYVGSLGYYWSSTLDGTDRAYHLGFYSVGLAPAASSVRNNGFSVRLVSAAQ